MGPRGANRAGRVLAGGLTLPNPCQNWAKTAKEAEKKTTQKKRGGRPQRCFILSEKVANMAPSWLQKSSPNCAKGARTTKKSKNNIDPTKRGVPSTGPSHFGGKCGQHGPNLGPKMEPKWRTRCENRSTNRCLSRSIFDAMLVDFEKENGAKLAPK